MSSVPLALPFIGHRADLLKQLSRNQSSANFCSLAKFCAIASSQTKLSSTKWSYPLWSDQLSCNNVTILWDILTQIKQSTQSQVAIGGQTWQQRYVTMYLLAPNANVSTTASSFTQVCYIQSRCH